MNTVTIYTKPACQPCRAQKKAFTAAGVAYVELPAREHMGVISRLGYRAAPVTVVRDTAGTVVDHWSGFRFEKARELKAG